MALIDGVGAAAMTNGDRPLSRQDSYRRFMGYTSSSTSSTLKSCGHCLRLLLTLLALLTVSAVLVIIVAIKPKKPQFDLQQASVSDILVSSAAAPATYLSLNATLLFAAHNPNGVKFRYSEVLFSVSTSHGVPIGLARVPGFDQPAHSKGPVKARLGINRLIHDAAAAAEIFADAAMNDRIELRIAGEVVARLPFMGLISPTVQVPVDCTIVISPRMQAVTSKQCGGDGVVTGGAG